MKISDSFRAKHLRDAKLNSRKFQINTVECKERGQQRSQRVAQCIMMWDESRSRSKSNFESVLFWVVCQKSANS